MLVHLATNNVRIVLAVGDIVVDRVFVLVVVVVVVMVVDVDPDLLMILDKIGESTCLMY